MRHFVRSLALAVISFVAIGAWVVQSEANGSADIRPLSAAEQRATWGTQDGTQGATQDCAQANLVSTWVCDGAFSAPCSRTWIGTCTATCRDGCTRVADLAPAVLGSPGFGFMTTKDCGVVPGLGQTYNVRDCNPITCCTGAILGNFFCTGVTVSVWIACGPTIP